MIDVKGTGALDREGARKWLRCMGFCASTHELDQMLNGRKPAILTKSWDLATLSAVAEGNAQRPNGSVEELQCALRRIAGGKSNLTRQKLVELSSLSISKE